MSPDNYRGEFHVTIENQFYTHEMSIKTTIPTGDEYLRINH